MKSREAEAFLVARWLRARCLRRAALLLAASFAVVAAVVVCTDAFTLSSAQQAQSDFGVYQRQTYDNIELGTLASDTLPRTATALLADAPRSHVYLQTTDLRPDAFTKTYVQSPIRTVQYLEDATLQQAFPGRYNLSSGSWPQHPFDVVVSQHVREQLPQQDQLTVLSGRARLRVVGTVTDSYARHDDLIIAAPGTFAAIPAPPPSHLFQPVGAQVTILFGGQISIDRIAHLAAARLPPNSAPQPDRIEAFTTNYETRAYAEAQPTASFGSSQQLVVSYVPLALVVLVLGALVIGQTRPDLQTVSDRLVTLGVRRRIVRRTQVIAFAVISAVAISIGLGAGWLIAALTRVLLLKRLADQPLSPIPWPGAPIVSVAGAALALVVVGALWPRRLPGGEAHALVARLVAELRLGLLRRVLAVVLVVTAVQVRHGQHASVAAYLLPAGILLFAPDLLDLATRPMRGRSPRALVAGRLMRAEAPRQALAAVVVGACLALPITASTQLASAKLSQRAEAYNRIPAHQVWVQRLGPSGDVDAVARLMSEVPGIGSPVVIRGLTTVAADGANGPAARFTQAPAGGSYGTDPMVVGSIADARRVLGDAWTPNAARLLALGGILDFTGSNGDQRLAVVSEGGAVQHTTPPLPTAYLPVNTQLRVQFAGVMLRQTARQLRLPISEPSKYIYTDTSAATIRAAVAAAVDGGYDSEFVQYDVPPPPPDLPASAYAFLAGLLLGGFALLWLVVRAQARRLRASSALLVALGLRPRWTITVLLLQAGIIVGVSVVCGITGGVLGVLVTSDAYVAVDVPVGPIVLAAAAFAATAAVATTVASRSLRAAEVPAG